MSAYRVDCSQNRPSKSMQPSDRYTVSLHISESDSSTANPIENTFFLKKKRNPQRADGCAIYFKKVELIAFTLVSHSVDATSHAMLFSF